MLRLVPLNVGYAVRYCSPKRIRARRADRDFDREFGIQTQAPIPVGGLDAEASALEHASPYAAVSAGLLRSALGALPIDDFSRYTFIDYGSGKGRALLIASEFDFSSIIGVELSSHLHRVAGANVEKVKSRLPERDRIILVNADAAEFVPQAGPKVAFFFNPFDEVIMRRVLQRIKDPITTPELLIIYVNPKNRVLFDDNDWQALVDHCGIAVYRRR
jgi:SAM-dependent methyltransferase